MNESEGRVRNLEQLVNLTRTQNDEIVATDLIFFDVILSEVLGLRKSAFWKTFIINTDDYEEI